MAYMAAFWMCEVGPTEIAGSDALNRNPLSCRQALKEDRPYRVGRVTTGRRKLRVLVVDDDHDTADALAILVRRWNHAARSAYDGARALREAAVQYPDVVLLDITMPHMDGCEVARQLRLDFPEHDCFIIALTGDGDEHIRQQCSDAGIDMVFIKPVEPSLIETLLMLECERINRARSGAPSEFLRGRNEKQMSRTGLVRRL
jgi:CheY-like chemotaxis protein